MRQWQQTGWRIRFLLNIIILLFTSSVYAQQMPPLGIQDEGGTIRRPVNTVNCVGTGINCTFSVNKGIITVSGASGDVVGPASATDNAIVRFDSTTGKIIQNSGITIDDSNNIVLPTTTVNSQSGIIYKGSQTWLHNYYPTGTSGGNIFLGLAAGNLTLSGSSGTQSSFNVGIGDNVLNSLTTGSQTIAIGAHALETGTNFSDNVGIGLYALQDQTSSDNTAVGSYVGRRGTGAENTLLGYAAGFGSSGNSTYLRTVMLGHSAGYSSRTNSYSTFIGWGSGYGVTTGVSNIMIGAGAGVTTTGSSNILIGSTSSGTASAASSSSASNELNIGNVLYGTGMYGTGKLGFTNAPTARLHLPAGTTSALSSPLKLTSGSLMTSAEVGANEYNDNFYDTKSNSVRYGRTGGAMFDHFADSTVGGAESDIYSDTLPANTFDVNGSKVLANYGGNFVTIGTELTQLQVKFAGTTIWDSTGVAPATGTTSWRVYVELIRVSSSVIRYTISLNTTGASGFVYCTVGELTGLTLTGTNILKITGTSTGVGSGSGDIIGKMSNVRYSAPAY